MITLSGLVAAARERLADEADEKAQEAIIQLVTDVVGHCGHAEIARALLGIES